MITVYIPTFPSLQITTSVINATTRKFKTRWSFEAAEDITHVGNLEEGIKKALRAQLKTPINDEELDFNKLIAYLKNQLLEDDKDTDTPKVLDLIQKFIDDNYDASCDALEIYGVLKDIGIIVEVEYECES